VERSPCLILISDLTSDFDWLKFLAVSQSFCLLLFGSLENVKTTGFSIRRGRRCAFTLIELLVVIAIIAILAALLLPALAGAKRRAKLAQCQSNFHQISVACYAYANDYNDYFPIDTGNQENGLYLPADSSFVVLHANLFGQNVIPHNTPVNTGIQNGVFDDLGLLYETRMIGNGKVLYCPSFPDTSLFSAAQFSHPSFMSTDSYGDVRDSMLFNPQVVNPMGPEPNDEARLFQKTGSVVPGRLFGMDCLIALTNLLNVGYTVTYPAFSPDMFAHYPSHGFDVLFTDGSVQFVQSVPAFNYMHQMGETDYAYSLLFYMLENGQ
jgi:prepilin-type N-terminal cleavage/methylation domain-containing protein